MTQRHQMVFKLRRSVGVARETFIRCMTTIAIFEGNELCIKMCIYIYIFIFAAFVIKTVAIFSATYTLQQLDIYLFLFIYSSLLSLCNHLVMKDQPPILF
jgi:hypothetical protein